MNILLKVCESFNLPKY